MPEPAILARDVSKRFELGQMQGGYELLSEKLLERLRSPRAKRRREPFWALRDIGFDVHEGETFGIIGHNGAGKSTLLKLLARVTPPTTGEIRLRGRVGALLEVGTGFHPELTGRENVFLNGAILGMTRVEIDRKFDEIVSFAEVERFIDTPVKRYSSGMYLRLAFAVAAHLEPEILIVDEVLSVGDLAFQEKCLGRMEKVAGEGRTVLFVSHNLTAVNTLCQRAMLLDRGRQVALGSTGDVIEEYIRGLRADEGASLIDRADRQGDGPVRFTEVAFETQGGVTDVGVTGRDLEIRLSYRTEEGRPVRDAAFSVAVYTLLGGLILHLESDALGVSFRDLPPEGEVRCVIPRCPLPAGRYWINVFVRAGGAVSDWIQRASDLTVAEGDFHGSGQRPAPSHQTVLVDHRWAGPDGQAVEEQAPPRTLNSAKERFA